MSGHGAQALAATGLYVHAHREGDGARALPALMTLSLGSS